MGTVKNEVALISYCALYCGACRKYKTGNCPGCANNTKATWCQVRTCNIEKNYKSCADCGEFANPMDCKKFNNIFSKVIGFIFRSNRAACIKLIKESGYENFAAYMSANNFQTIRK